MTKSQSQESIPLEYDSGEKHCAVRNGNNAAWMCICGYRLPLIWSSFQSEMPTVCGGCGKKFTGKGQGNKPERIYEETP